MSIIRDHGPQPGLGAAIEWSALEGEAGVDVVEMGLGVLHDGPGLGHLLLSPRRRLAGIGAAREPRQPAALPVQSSGSGPGSTSSRHLELEARIGQPLLRAPHQLSAPLFEVFSRTSSSSAVRAGQGPP